jgi:hypothetical protein
MELVESSMQAVVLETRPQQIQLEQAAAAGVVW